MDTRELRSKDEVVKMRNGISHKNRQQMNGFKSLFKNWVKKLHDKSQNKENINYNQHHSHKKDLCPDEGVEFHNIFKTTSLKNLDANSIPENEHKFDRPIMIRNASKGFYKGQGIEISDLNDILEKARQTSILSECSSTAANSNEYQHYALKSNHIHDSYSDDLDSLFSDLSDDLNEILSEEESRDYDPNYEYDYHTDDDCYVHNATNSAIGANIPSVWDNQYQILSHSLMRSFRNHLPQSIADQNFWLKYSLATDGASIYNLLHCAQGSDRTILAIETADGEVFGSFTSNTWNIHNGFFGSGESFLWRSSNPKRLDIYPWTGKNFYVQYCNDNLIGLGGVCNNNNDKKTSSGFGLALDSDLLLGFSEPCETFDNPRLAQLSPDGIFEVANIEVWSFTPCFTLEDAEKLEARKRFLGIVQ